MPASPRSIAHRGCSVSAERNPALTDVGSSFSGLFNACCRLGVSWRCFIRLIRTPVKAVVCRPVGELKTPEVCCWLYTSTHSIRGFVTGFVLATHGWRHILWSPPVCFHPVGDPPIILCFGCHTGEWNRVEQFCFGASLLFVQDSAFFSLFFLLIVFSPGWQSAEMPLCNLTSYYNFSLLINWNMSWNHHV